MMEFVFDGKEEFFQFVTGLVDSNVYDRQPNVLPYTPDSPLTVVAFYPQLPVGATVNFFLNGLPAGSALVVDSTGFVYVDLSMPLGTVLLTAKDQANNILSNQYFRTLNLYLYLKIFGALYKTLRIEGKKEISDTNYLTVRNNRIYPNFGFLYDFANPFYLTFGEYRDMLLGTTPTTGIKTAYSHQCTVQGVIDVIAAFGGILQEPPSNIFASTVGWKIYSKTAPPYTQHYYIKDPARDPLTSVTINKPITFLSGKLKSNTVLLKIQGIERDVIREPIVRQATLQTPDYSQNKYFNYNLPVTVVDSNNVPYTAGVDFVVGFNSGKILWYVDDGFGNNILSGTAPAAGSVYFITYNFFPIDLLNSVLMRIKPAHIRLREQFYDQYGVLYYTTVAQFDISTFDSSTSTFG